MEKAFIAVRDVDKEVFRQFRIMSIKEKLKLGRALTIAMKKLIEEEENKKNRGINTLLSIKPFDFGAGSERLSKEVDKVIYG